MASCSNTLKRHLAGAGWLIIMGFTTYFFFPETAGVPVENAHAVFQDHWFWPKAYPEIREVRSLDPVLFGSSQATLYP